MNQSWQERGEIQLGIDYVLMRSENDQTLDKKNNQIEKPIGNLGAKSKSIGGKAKPKNKLLIRQSLQILLQQENE